MRTSRSIEEQIAALRRAEGATPVLEVCRRLGVTVDKGGRDDMVTSGRSFASLPPELRRHRAPHLS